MLQKWRSLVSDWLTVYDLTDVTLVSEDTDDHDDPDGPDDPDDPDESYLVIKVILWRELISKSYLVIKAKYYLNLKSK